MILIVKKPTRNWKGDKPDWKAIVTLDSRGIILDILPTDPNGKGAMKFLFLDKGTRANYPIRPKPPNRFLAFKSEYTAGSRPGTLETTTASSGGKVIFSRGVIHPGIKARGWTEMITTEFEPKFMAYLQKYAPDIAKATGHAL